MKEVIGLYQLNQYIKQVVDINFDQAIWIRCELASVRQNRGHWYLELVENHPISQQIVAQSTAVIWAGDFIRIASQSPNDMSTLLRQGTEVQLLVELNFHERFGLKLVVREIDYHFSLGKMEIMRREILAKLQKQQLLDLNKMVKLPLVVQNIAVISSANAAGYLDFKHSLENNPYGYQFYTQLFQTSMQGEKVARELPLSLLSIDPDRFDAVVIVRGGGSKLDLSDFDHYDIGKSIAHCPIPVITGIGHEIDLSIADLCAHTSCKTPTAVAEFIINRASHFEGQLIQFQNELEKQLLSIWAFESKRLERLQEELTWNVKQLVMVENEQLRAMTDQLRHLVSVLIDSSKEQLKFYTQMLKSLNLQSVLERGFTVVRSVDGLIVKKVGLLRLGQQISVVFQDGLAHSQVIKISKNAEKEG